MNTLINKVSSSGFWTRWFWLVCLIVGAGITGYVIYQKSVEATRLRNELERKKRELADVETLAAVKGNTYKAAELKHNAEKLKKEIKATEDRLNVTLEDIHNRQTAIKNARNWKELDDA